MGFPRQEYWSGLPFPPPGDLPHPGIEPMTPVSPALASSSWLQNHSEREGNHFEEVSNQVECPEVVSGHWLLHKCQILPLPLSFPCHYVILLHSINPRCYVFPRHFHSISIAGQKMVSFMGVRKGVPVNPSVSDFNQHFSGQSWPAFLELSILPAFTPERAVWLPSSATHWIVWLVFPDTPVVNLFAFHWLFLLSSSPLASQYYFIFLHEYHLLNSPFCASPTENG